MATFTKDTSLYEILIRVRPDGSWAAQYQTLTEVKEDGIVLNTAVDSVLPLNTEDAAAFTIVEQLIGNSAAKNLVEHQKLLEKSENDARLIAELQDQILSLQPKNEAE